MNLRRIKIKNIKPLLLSLIILLIFITKINAQTIKKVQAVIEAQTVVTTSDAVPFWMRSNRFGSIPLSGASASITARINKDYQQGDQSKDIDWGFGFDGRTNAGNGTNFQLIEAYGKLKIWMFQLKAGRAKDVMGLNGDTLLSTGNFSESGNALGIPKMELSIPNYYSIPIFGGLFSVKGNFVHGWVGKTKIMDRVGPVDKPLYYITNTNPNTYFHQKSLYVRFGKPDWKLKLYGGFNHQVYWGSEKDAYGNNFKLSPLKTFMYVAMGKSYGARGVPTSKIGNQLGSLDLGVAYDFENISVMLYRQNLYDVGALSKLANIADGLNGISIENKRYDSNQHKFKWKKILFELFYTKDQAGYPWSIPTQSGDEDYYNNFYYLEGWSYKGLGMGNPFITPRHNARAGQAYRNAEYFINNRVVAVHMGLSGTLNNWDFNSKISYSRNYGTFGSSIYGGSTGRIRNPQTTHIFVPVQQFSFYLESMKKFNHGYSFGFATAIDHGKLLDNSVGLELKARKNL